MSWTEDTEGVRVSGIAMFTWISNGTSLPLNFFGSVIFGIIEDPSSVMAGSVTPVLRKHYITSQFLSGESGQCMPVIMEQ